MRMTVRAAIALAVALMTLGGFGAGVAAANGVEFEQCDPYTPRFKVRVGATWTSCLP